MSESTRSGGRWIGAIALLSLLVTACSVTTPRGASVETGAGSGLTTADSTGAGTGLATSGDASTPGGAVVSDAPSGGSTGGSTSSGGASGGASGGGDEIASSGGAPGVSAEKIRISVVAGFSGALAAVVRQAFAGLETWRDDVNAAGGIFGRKVELVQVDHKETADGGIAACKQALSNDTYFAAVLEGVEANLTAVSCLDAAKVPTLYFSGTVDPDWKLGFSDSITSAQGGKILASYVRNRLGGGKVGAIYVNQLAYKATVDAFVPTARDLGVDVGPVEAVEPNQASFTPQLLRMKKAGVQIVLISATAEAIGIIRDARSMGWSPTFTGFGFTFDFVTAAARDLFRNVTGLRPNATVDSPAYERYAARMEANGRGRARSLDTEGFLAYAHGLVMTEMLKRAGEDPTRASLVAGTETIRGYDNGILPPISFSRSDHVGVDAGFIAVCCNSDYTWKATGPARASF